MKKVLVTGGTVFVSRYIAEYYVAKGCEVYVLNRNTRQQSQGVTLIEADRHDLGDTLHPYAFDLVVDTAYTAADVELLLNALGDYKDYILISSSAVYPEHETQPFTEDTPVGPNTYWGAYGLGKIEAEKALLTRVPNAYILRPPYLYGPMNNVYREAFVFDCALAGRKFYLPNTGDMKLQFFHVEDLCRFMDAILAEKPEQHIFNVGNNDSISVLDWVSLCYKLAGKQVEFVHVAPEVEQRKYFPFYNYEYYLDVQRQRTYLPHTKPMEDGLSEALQWYKEHSDSVSKKPYFDYIDTHLV